MKYVDKMSSSAMIHILSFITIGSSVQNLKEIYSYTDTARLYYLKTRKFG
jgi:hypothetical protein